MHINVHFVVFYCCIVYNATKFDLYNESMPDTYNENYTGTAINVTSLYVDPPLNDTIVEPRKYDGHTRVMSIISYAKVGGLCS